MSLRNQTDKATMEVEAVDEGVVEAILVAEGTEEVEVNTPIARLAGGDTKPAPAAPTPEAVALARVAVAAPAPVQMAVAKGGRVYASPLARRIASQKGLDLASVKGTGPHGRIVQGRRGKRRSWRR